MTLVWSGLGQMGAQISRGSLREAPLTQLGRAVGEGFLKGLMAEMSLEEYADQAGKGARLGKREGVRSMGGRRGLG